MSKSAPLHGVRVVAVEQYLAGNYGSYLMALMGAEVIKVEPPGTGDPQRKATPYVVSKTGKRSHGELRVMAGKRSVELDLKTPEGRTSLGRLVSHSDVLWTNLKPDSLSRLGITYEWLKSHNPGIVYTTLSGFGHGDLLPPGPAMNLSAFDVIAQGMAGLQFRPEGNDGRPAYNGLALGDQVTSIFAVVGTLAALYRRQQAGVGERVDVAMYDAMVSLNEKALGVYSLTGKLPPRGRSGTAAPYGAFRAADGFVNIGVGGEAVWQRFCRAMDQPELASDPRFDVSVNRVANEDALIRLVESWTEKRTRSQIVATMMDNNVPCAPLYDVSEIFDEPQANARKMFIEFMDPVVGKTRIVGNPIKMSGLVDFVPHAPHALGADNDDIRETLIDKR